MSEEVVFHCIDECVLTDETCERRVRQRSRHDGLVDKLDDGRLPPTQFRAWIRVPGNSLP